MDLQSILGAEAGPVVVPIPGVWQAPGDGGTLYLAIPGSTQKRPHFQILRAPRRKILGPVRRLSR